MQISLSCQNATAAVDPTAKVEDISVGVITCEMPEDTLSRS